MSDIRELVFQLNQTDVMIQNSLVPTVRLLLQTHGSDTTENVPLTLMLDTLNEFHDRIQKVLNKHSPISMQEHIEFTNKMYGTE